MSRCVVKKVTQNPFFRLSPSSIYDVFFVSSLGMTVTAPPDTIVSARMASKKDCTHDQSSDNHFLVSCVPARIDHVGWVVRGYC